MHGPDPTNKHPMEGFPRVCFIKNTVSNPNIVIGHYVVVGGNPAKVIKQRFPPEIVQALLQTAWWDWDIEKITRNLNHIVSADIEGLRRAE